MTVCASAFVGVLVFTIGVVALIAVPVRRPCPPCANHLVVLVTLHATSASVDLCIFGTVLW